ncbi:MAG: MG2 domain-containing protein [Verrucomicrobiales bacterium]
MKPIIWTLAMIVSGLTVCLTASGQTAISADAMRTQAVKLQQEGNYKDALAVFQKLTLEIDSNADEPLAGDLSAAFDCLMRLGQQAEVDALLEKAVKRHSTDWRLLWRAATLYQNVPHYGVIIDGDYQRGRGGRGQFVNTLERDRVRALQLFEQAIPLAEQSASEQLYRDLARLLQMNQGSGAWRFQVLTSTAELPDFGDPQGVNRSGAAPVDADGKPVYYAMPESWAAAKNDGERWRWALAKAGSASAAAAARSNLEHAQWLQQQFGVQTMAWGPRIASDVDANDTGRFAVHTLKESETIARLATGVQRFSLPDEFNFIKILRTVAQNRADESSAQSAHDQLASIFENRRQYDKAAAVLVDALETFGNVDHRQRRLKQITGNWGRFENSELGAAGQPAKLGFVFRNGTKASFRARSIDIESLVADVKAYLKSNPERLDWNKVQLDAIGYQILQDNYAKYVKDEVAKWDVDLHPREKHWDKRIDVITPLSKAGAYLVTGAMADGNASEIVVWLTDLALVKKNGDGGSHVFVCDAATGTPAPKANLAFFGYEVDYIQNRNNKQRRQANIKTREFAEFGGEDGQFFATGKRRFEDRYNWLITATTSDGKMGMLGFSGIWINQNGRGDQLNQTKVYTITDRPVYRPGQEVKIKAWIREVNYDLKDVSKFTDKKATLIVNDPRGQKVIEKELRGDSYGGIDHVLMLAEGATLGNYSIQINGKQFGGYANFRVEEYKKPEFEVKVNAPTEPISLGEKITAEIVAKYYFGAPVVNATVKYKVMRSDHSANWYPTRPWDWMYGPGYWWFGYDYDWYPGWYRWGCIAPAPWWQPFASNPPELVMENEVAIGADGTVKIEIDTALAKELHGDTDHRYQITAEVVDESRRTIVGQGAVLVAREPFRVYGWTDRGHYETGDTISASFQARTPDGKGVAGKGKLQLLAITYNDAMEPQEKVVAEYDLEANEDGYANQKLSASEKGQYRLSYKLTDSKGHVMEGGHVFVVRGAGFDGREFRFSQLELIPDKAEYAPGEKLKLMINAEHADSTVALFVRPADGAYSKPEIIRLTGKSTVHTVDIAKGDMPNFFIEAFTVHDGKVRHAVREVIVPPEKRVLNLAVEPSEEIYKPGSKAKVKLRLTDHDGKPFVGTTVVSVYDKALEYISGGANVPDIREFFWKWRRNHYTQSETNLMKAFGNLIRPGTEGMQTLGVFGNDAIDMDGVVMEGSGQAFGGARMMKSRMAMPMSAAAPAAEMVADAAPASVKGFESGGDGEADSAPEVTVRTDFADSAFWIATLNTDKDGHAEAEWDMPDDLTTWKIRSWAMGSGTRVGEGTAEVITSKDLLVRLQAPRFSVEKDEVVVSANVHNYLDAEQLVQVSLETDGQTMEAIDSSTLNSTITLTSGGEQRVDWRMRVLREGTAMLRVKAVASGDSDAMEMEFPVFVHGMLKTDSYSGVLRPDDESGKFVITVPTERRPEQSRLEIRYSPTLAGAMVDALPYLIDFPYGCTEQTLNRFVPTVITQKVLKDMGLDLAAIRDKRTNLNAQEIGNDQARAKQWKRFDREPVFSETEAANLAKDGLEKLTNMQNSDGGWGWFYGTQERSYPHTTCVVVHGLQAAQEAGLALVPGVRERGVAWLKDYQAAELQKLKNAPTETKPWKNDADNIDAFVYSVLVDADVVELDMMKMLYRDRTKLSPYSNALLGYALDKHGRDTERDMILRNLEQFLVMDAENQTAYLKTGNLHWWHWYGSDIETQAAYLRLLSRVKPKSPEAAGVAKFLINNRKNATYWTSTRDTAFCIEALAGFMRASGEDKPDMTMELYVDGQKHQEVKIDRSNLFQFDNSFVLEGDAVTAGEHTVEFRKRGTGPLYYNAYLTNFTLEDNISKAGLEVKVERSFRKLTPADQSVKVGGAGGQALDQKVEKYEKTLIKNGDFLKSGDLVEVELIVESKNDYEYLIFEDMKAAGFEAVDVQSGYTNNGLGAYMELRDERVAFFVRQLPMGKHNLTYRLRAEIPGKFSALPAKASAMYAPGLKGNSDEAKLVIED